MLRTGFCLACADKAIETKKQDTLLPLLICKRLRDRIHTLPWSK